MPNIMTPEFCEKLEKQANDQAAKVFELIEKMLTTEAGTPEREQIKKEFIYHYANDMPSDDHDCLFF